MPTLRLASWIALLALLAACSGQGPVLTSRAGLGPDRKARAGGALPAASVPAGARGGAAEAQPGVVGAVLVPSRLVAELGALVLSNGGGSLISDHGGALLGHPRRAFRLAALGAEGLAGLRVVLLDREGRRVPGVEPVVTDGQGAFTLAAPPEDGLYTVAADLWDGKRAGTMKARARVQGRAGQATLTLASTFVLVGTEGRTPDVEAEARAIVALTPRLDDSDPPRLFDPRAILERLGKLEAEIAELKAALGGLGQRVDGLEARVEALAKV
jgi:hypothetical protein